MPSVRISYFDIAKGLLVILLCLHHINDASAIYGVESDTFKLVTSWQSLYTAFFMQAFLIISGYCTTFRKPFATFIKDNAIKLLLPVVIFEVLTKLLQFAYIQDSGILKELLVWRYWIIEPQYWFLFALLWSKCFVWCLKRLNVPSTVNFTLTICMIALGIFAKAQNIANVLSFQHALLAVFFVYLGSYLREQERYYKKALQFLPICYPIILIITKLLHQDILTVSWGLRLQYLQIPQFLITTIAGTFFILFICKRIKTNRILEYIGKNSLIFYCLQFVMIGIFSSILFRIFEPQTYLSGGIFISFVVLATLLFCAIVTFLKHFIISKKPPI